MQMSLNDWCLHFNKGNLLIDVWKSRVLNKKKKRKRKPKNQNIQLLQFHVFVFHADSHTVRSDRDTWIALLLFI